ncbi:MAG: DUF763 domain-containing protein [Methanobacteriota archaeon]|nr:MAG: DUF763 domain-containing protein [Euryarchaeota archaeon]
MRSAKLPLHPGKAPPWLFSRMRKMAGVITELIIDEYGTGEFLKRLASPFWFQAFACVLGFDWHSSGTTPTTIAAIREGYKGEEISVFGGKGKKMKEATPEQEEIGDNAYLVHSLFSKGIDDGYSLYIASTITDGKDYVVIDQGMNKISSFARRYHWHGSNELYRDEENIAGIKREALNTVSKKSAMLRKTMLDIIKDNYAIRAWNSMRGQRMLFEDDLSMPRRHDIRDVDISKRDVEMFAKLYEYQPTSYEEVMTFRGVGPKKIRALALIANLIYGEELDWRDPVKYSYAHGGKDGIPYPVDRELYDENIEMLKNSVEEAKIESNEKRRALKKLSAFFTKSCTD